GIFRPGYEPNDEQLRESVKNLWMTTHYGSTPWAVVHAQHEKPRTYGPGYVGPTAATRLLEHLPGSRDMSMFKKMCRALAKAALERDRTGGVLFIDPLDGLLFRWNTLAYRTNAISCAGGRVMIQIPGTWAKHVEGWWHGQVFNRSRKVWVTAT